MRFINIYPVELKYGVQRHINLFLQMLYFDNYAVCNINSDDVYKIQNWKHRQAPRPLHKQNKPIVSLSQKSRTHTPSQQACGEKVGVSNYEAYNSDNLPHIPKLTSSSHVHKSIRKPKNHCFVNVILQIIYSVLRTTHQKMYFNHCVEGTISECLFDTAHKTLKLELSTYNSFFTGETQEDACEWTKGLGYALLMTIHLVGCRFLNSYFHSFWKNTLYMTYIQWNRRLLKPPVCYMSPQLIVPPCRNYWCRSSGKNV